jgi:hypothetical protein
MKKSGVNLHASIISEDLQRPSLLGSFRNKPLGALLSVAAIVILAVIVPVAMYRSMAGGAFIFAEAESGALASGAVKGTDAAASGGSYVTFSAPPSSPPPLPVNHIYWGATIEGTDTYNYYFPGQRPGGSFPGLNGWANAPWDQETWNKFEADAGKKVSIAHWGQPTPWKQTGVDTSAATISANRGAINMIDMGGGDDSLTTMINGGYDASIKTWATNVKNFGKPLFLRPWWEMNGTWFTWGSQAASNPTLYVNAWRHWHDLAVAQGATNITWVWCPNLEFPGTTNLQLLYPGDSYVDWTCIDGYNWGTKHGDPWRSFADLYTATYNNIVSIAPSKPVMIGEVASEETGGNKAAWITDTLSTLPTNFPKVKAFVWFNWRINESGQNWEWPIESSPAALAAFKSGISTSYYAPNLTNYPAALTKVQPLQ